MHHVRMLVRDASCPVAVAPYGFGEEPPRVLRRVGVAFDGWSTTALAVTPDGYRHDSTGLTR